MQCCVEKLLIQILQVDPNALNEQELEQLKLIGRLAVALAETLNGPWKGGELVQTLFHKGERQGSHR